MKRFCHASVEEHPECAYGTCWKGMGHDVAGDRSKGEGQSGVR